MSNSISVTEFVKEVHLHSKGKVCTKCKEHKLLSEYHADKSNKKYGLVAKCKSCQKEYDDNVCPFKKRFKSKKTNAKVYGIEFTIEPTDIPGVKVRRFIVRGKPTWEATEYPKVCSKWGLELDWSMSGVQHINSPSLDRIDPTKGYIPGNVRLVCQSYNAAKSNCPPNEWDIIEKTIARSILFGE